MMSVGLPPYPAVARLGLERRDLGRNVAVAQHRGGTPRGLGVGQGTRHDVLVDVVHPLAEVVMAHARPRGREALVGDPAEQERFGVEQFLVLELVAFFAAVEVQ